MRYLKKGNLYSELNINCICLNSFYFNYKKTSLVLINSILSPF